MPMPKVLIYLWDLLRRPFQDCTSCCSVLDSAYYRQTSPGVQRLPQQLSRWDRDIKNALTPSRAVSSVPSSQRDGFSSRRSKTSSSDYFSFKEADDQPVQFLFYGGSDPPTPRSAAVLLQSGYRSDAISSYTLAQEPVTRSGIESPRISHEMPCFFSPRDAPTSPVASPMYSPHLFKISENSQRRSGYFMRYSR